VFLDAPAALFASDGVSPDVVRAGEPRVRRSKRLDTVVRQPVAVRRRAAVHRLLHPVSS
jgi:hypothetical protein